MTTNIIELPPAFRPLKSQEQINAEASRWPAWLNWPDWSEGARLTALCAVVGSAVVTGCVVGEFGVRAMTALAGVK